MPTLVFNCYIPDQSETSPNWWGWCQWRCMQKKIYGAENYGILIWVSAGWIWKVSAECHNFLIPKIMAFWKGTTFSVELISLSTKLLYDICFKPAERRKYFFRYSVNVGEIPCDIKQIAIISAETSKMFLNLILASICIEQIWGDENFLVIPVTTQISAQPLHMSKSACACVHNFNIRRKKESF